MTWVAVGWALVTIGAALLALRADTPWENRWDRITKVCVVVNLFVVLAWAYS